VHNSVMPVEAGTKSMNDAESNTTSSTLTAQKLHLGNHNPELTHPKSKNGKQI